MRMTAPAIRVGNVIAHFYHCINTQTMDCDTVDLPSASYTADNNVSEFGWIDDSGDNCCLEKGVRLALSISDSVRPAQA